jgi:hypothetical protein
MDRYERQTILSVWLTATMYTETWFNNTPGQRYTTIISRFPQLSLDKAMTLANIYDYSGFKQYWMSRKN